MYAITMPITKGTTALPQATSMVKKMADTIPIKTRRRRDELMPVELRIRESVP